MSDLPIPQTRTVRLVPAARDAIGNPIRRATLHDYVRTDETPEGDFAFIFRCEETGTERRFGLEGEHDKPEEQ